MPSNIAKRRRSKAKGVQFHCYGRWYANHIKLLMNSNGISRAGASGTGRTTFVNTLCESQVLPHKECDNPESAVVETGVSIKPVNVDIEEDGLRISLTIVDTPGFGDSVDNDLAYVSGAPIRRYPRRTIAYQA
ncbi:Septin-domain-containing protein [Rhodocollybia butyracea]|uniref:Septin-domain-containing protein n=1 Tax=Rhodocollybia butyracea TaxID=206335 RepID=A0A9P5P4V0_9AGAR|nr:Septin-domain-containing protein [Rhodocollybia butyracea]